MAFLVIAAVAGYIDKFVSSSNFSYDLYDTNGNLLKGRIKGNIPYTYLHKGIGKEIVGVFSLLRDPDDYEKVLLPRELELLKKTGWTKENYFDDPSILVIGSAE